MAQINRPAAIIRFGVFEVDLRTGELRKSSFRIPLQEPFKVLASLLEHPGEMVTRGEAHVGSLGQSAPARVVGVARPDEPHHRRANHSDRCWRWR